MALVAWPTEARIVEISHEVWSPGRIVHRLRSGDLDTPLVRGQPRLVGTVSLGLYGRGNYAGAAAVELLLAELADPENFVDMPWGGDRASGGYPSPIGWEGDVTAAASGVYTFARRVGRTEVVEPGDWLSRGRVAMVRTVSGTAAAPVLTLIPDIPMSTGDTLFSAPTIRIRKRDPDESGILVPRSATGFAGGVTFEWEEV